MRKDWQAFLDTVSPIEEEVPYLRVMLYGDSGQGKTVLATTFGERILYLDSADGWVSLRNHPDLAAKCQRVPYQGLSQIDTMTDMIKAGELSEFDTVIVDEASTIATFDLDTVLAARSKKDPSKDPNVPTQPDFFANTERCRRSFMGLLKAPIHVIFVAHMREDKDDRTGVVTKRPAFSPKLRATVEQNMHLVAHMTAQERRSDSEVQYDRFIQTLPSRGINAKSRIGGLPYKVKNPNLSELLSDFQLLKEGTEVELPQEPDASTEESNDNDFPFGE